MTNPIFDQLTGEMLIDIPEPDVIPPDEVDGDQMPPEDQHAHGGDE